MFIDFLNWKKLKLEIVLSYFRYTRVDIFIEAEKRKLAIFDVLYRIFQISFFTKLFLE